MTFVQEVQWTKHHIARLNIGGVWAVPRSGLVFQKTTEGVITLITAMPFEGIDKTIAELADVPKTPGDLLKWQQQDFDCIRKRAEAGGIIVLSKVEGIK